jgi:hypothetical protein
MKFIENYFHDIPHINYKGIKEYAGKYGLDENDIETLMRHFIKDVENEVSLIEIDENEYKKSLIDSDMYKGSELFMKFKKYFYVIDYNIRVKDNFVFIKIIYGIYGYFFEMCYKINI